ncbi:MAG: tRNA 5-methoxyuridine(34)/uridine 5-oxyacetic acid(34) synthase CmoB, partial [Nitrospinota bacterium]
IPKALDQFDTVFSMGVLYHRRSPVDHLMKLRSLIGKGGQLVLETLVVDGGDRDVLVPSGRYGKMNNVWFIPAPKALELWLTRCGFQDVRLIDITKTTPDEQRKTEWMTFESLTDFLNPNNSEETIEGLPAPKRAIFIARNG